MHQQSIYLFNRSGANRMVIHDPDFRERLFDMSESVDRDGGAGFDYSPETSEGKILNAFLSHVANPEVRDAFQERIKATLDSCPEPNGLRHGMNLTPAAWREIIPAIWEEMSLALRLQGVSVPELKATVLDPTAESLPQGVWYNASGGESGAAVLYTNVMYVTQFAAAVAVAAIAVAIALPVVVLVTEDPNGQQASGRATSFESLSRVARLVAKGMPIQ